MKILWYDCGRLVWKRSSCCCTGMDLSAGEKVSSWVKEVATGGGDYSTRMVGDWGL